MDKYSITFGMVLSMMFNPFDYLHLKDNRKRFDYFMERVNRFEDNEALRYDLFTRLMNVKTDLFWWHDWRDENFDCFIEVLDTLFDSDSYVELNNKLEAIESVSCFVKTKDRVFSTYYNLLDKLKSGKYKDQFNNRIIEYKDGLKPDRLIDRMSDEALKEVHKNAKTIEEMVLALGKYDDDYDNFCHNYVKKIENDLEDLLPFFSNFPKGYEHSKWEEDCDIPFNTRVFESDSWEERKKYIISKFKELGLDKKFRDKFISCYDENKYGFLNLYMIAIVYEFQKNNYENFAAILDDMVVVSDYCTEFTALEFFKYFVGFFLACEDYKDIKDMRESFKFFLNNFDGRCYSDVVNNVVKRCRYIVDCKDNFCKNEVYGLNMRKVLEGREIYFNPLFIREKGRLSYINNKLYEVETNPSIREEIFRCLCQLFFNPFDVLNEGNDKDSFFECMDIIFDSDTYSEMFEKIKAVRNAGELCFNGKKIEGLEIIKHLKDASYKEVLNGKVVAYPENSINMVNKPKRIIDRMKELYSRIDDSTSYDFLDEVHDKAVFSEDIDRSVVSYRNKFGNKVKRLFVNSRRNKK